MQQEIIEQIRKELYASNEYLRGCCGLLLLPSRITGRLLHRHSAKSTWKHIGACEDTEHLIDWTIDLWSTFDILIDRFGEAGAIQIVTASESLLHTREQEAMLV